MKPPGSSGVGTLPSNIGTEGVIFGQGAKIPCALWPKKTQNITQKQYCNKFNKDIIHTISKQKIITR